MHRCFTPQTHQNALRDPQIPPDAKKQVRRNVSPPALYMETAEGPPKHEK
jgi:hypothetical protein